MDSFEGLSPKEWEKFCEVMLRKHFSAKHFYLVPDQDGGDLGIEFYTTTGTIFQCYYPDKNIAMAEYKRRVQKKINDDLKKLSTNKDKITELLGDVVIDQWVLLIPENKSKDLISYCHRKEREVIKKGLSFIDNKEFTVKIETAESYPDAKLYAQGVYSKAVHVPISEVTEEETKLWMEGHSEFSGNISRKSNAIVGSSSEGFQGKVVTKYIQIEKFLDHLRDNYPDLHHLIEDSARAQLEKMQEGAVLESDIDRNFIKHILKDNEEAFEKFSQYMSDHNVQTLSFGFLSKWLAECYMDFNK